MDQKQHQTQRHPANATPQAEREAAQKADEEEFRRRLMAKFAEDDRIEQMNAQVCGAPVRLLLWSPLIMLVLLLLEGP